MRRLIYTFFSLLFSAGIAARSQVLVPIYDRSKHYQLRSMEEGPWDFDPVWWYYWNHRSYSGAKSKWRWHGFESGYYVRFNENHYAPNAKQRSRMLAEAIVARKKYEKVTNAADKVYKRELLSVADRAKDVAWSACSDRYNKLLLLFTRRMSEYRTNIGVDDRYRAYALEQRKIASAISYMKSHYVRNADRQKAYAQQLEGLERLIVSLNSSLKTYYSQQILTDVWKNS